MHTAVEAQRADLEAAIRRLAEALAEARQRLAHRETICRKNGRTSRHEKTPTLTRCRGTSA